ncbi:phosphoheptose isomerase [bacterium BMS3Abin05]|nr:phosphoheptose isomerase [bacterium BMS3Abin05]GBE28533.1 phosphoheptose isomerase [bacterium BMS3Bbin03]HDZ10956.1 SIS domain-containing protein [Bacteroidota bacterium]
MNTDFGNRFAGLIRDQLKASAEVKLKIAETILPDILEAGQEITLRLKAGGTLFFCGNGGSAADSQHLTAELVSRLRMERAAIPAVALTTDTSILTAMANDYDYSQIFSRQVEALGRKGDVLLGISTSGNAANVIEAMKVAKRTGLYRIGLLGKNGGKLKDFVDTAVIVPSFDTQRIQEGHITIGHILCDIVEQVLFGQA